MKNKTGFTLSETLITLSVIGIIAAITIPILAENGRRSEVETKLKKTISVLNNALMRASVDYGAISSWPELNTEQATSPTNFMGKYIAPYVQTTRVITNNSEGLTLEDLGYKDKKIQSPSGGPVPFIPAGDPPLPRIFFLDGTVILRLVTSSGTNSINYLVDVNGPKGPNVIGRDIFAFALEGRLATPTVLMYGLREIKKDNTTGKYNIKDRSIEDLKENCADTGQYCGALIQQNGWKIPRDYPVKI